MGDLSNLYRYCRDGNGVHRGEEMTETQVIVKLWNGDIVSSRWMKRPETLTVQNEMVDLLKCPLEVVTLQTDDTEWFCAPVSSVVLAYIKTREV